jgi:hypothetical protein
MPLVLMLEDIFGKFSHWVKRLEKWNQLVSLEETLAGRARSAFLVHWFGPSIPLQDSHLRVYIANFEELRSKYNAAKKAPAFDPDKPSLLEPAAGFAGTLVGMLGAPLNSAFLYEWVFKAKQNWYTGAFAVANIISLGFLGAALTAVVGVFSLVALPWAAESQDASELIDKLAWIAPYAISLRGWWKQILGLRKDVKDPIFRQVLWFGDAVAQLLPHLFGFVAIIIGRIGKLIQPLWDQAKALIEFAKFMGPLIQRVILNTLDLIKDLFSKTGEHSLLHPFLLIFDFLKHKTLPVLEKMFSYLLAPLPMLINRGNQIAKWWDKISALFEKRFIEGGIPALIDEMTKRLKLVSTLWAKTAPPAPPPPPPSSPSTIDKALGLLSTWIKGRLPSNPIPHLTLPDVRMLEHLLGKPALGLAEADIKKEAKRLLKSSKMPAELILTGAEEKKTIAQPPGVFGAEQRKLESSVGKQYPGLPRKEALAAPYAEERRLRMLLFEAARRILMPDLAGQILKLEPVFRKVEGKLHLRRHPIKQLEEFKELRPVIGELRVRSSEGNEDTLNKWSASLRKALGEQYYEVAVA